MSVNEDALDVCERQFAAAGRLAKAVADASTVLVELAKLLEVTVGADPGFLAEEASSDASRSAASARWHLRGIRRIAEIREVDLADQLAVLRKDREDQEGDGA